MRIGAGGLQSIITQELMQKQSDQLNRIKPMPDLDIIKFQELTQNLLKHDLNKAVELLNNFVRLYNHDLEFSLGSKNKSIRLKWKGHHSSEEYSPEDLLCILQGNEIDDDDQQGKHLDSYA